MTTEADQLLLHRSSRKQHPEQDETPPPPADTTPTTRMIVSASTRTYVAGEDASRLASAARYLGLPHDHDHSATQRRRSRFSLWTTTQEWLNDPTLTAARMHSVGALGRDERIDGSGTLHHYVTVRRRRRRSQRSTSNSGAAAVTTTYGSLRNLFALEQEGEKVLQQQDESLEEEEEEFEEENIDVVEGGSLQAAIFGIVKGTVGPAILYLPAGFQTSGYAVAVPAMVFATCMYIYNAHRLLACWRVESERNHKVAARVEQVRALLELGGDGSQDDTQSFMPFTPTLLTYPELARRAFSSKYSVLVDFGISSMQFGVCLTYLIFVPANLYQCTLAVFGVAVPKFYFLLAMILIEIPLSWISDIRKLTPTNVLATILIVFGLCAVMFMGIGQSLRMDGALADNLASLPAVTDAWFIFIGTSFFMMEGSITLLVPLQEAVFLPQDKAKFPAVNETVTIWIVVFYICFSFICVAGFGAGLQTAMTASLKGALASTVQLAYAIAVILTFPLQAFPAMEVICQTVMGNAKKSSKFRNNSRNSAAEMRGSFKRQILATVVTCLLGLVALIAIDYLGNVVSILGSLFGIPLALVFPPLMHNQLVKDSSTTIRMMNYCVVVIGVLAMGVTSFATIVSWNRGANSSR